MRQNFDTPLLDSLRQARAIVVFSGAGVSAESGIATFRNRSSGLWERFDPAKLATAEAFERDPALVWGWYEWRRMQVLRAQPNPAHLAIAALAQQVPRLQVVTQNVDDLHERAGSHEVIHLHGSLRQPRCFDCGVSYMLSDTPAEQAEDGRLAAPHCTHCGGLIRPGVVWFGEQLPQQAWQAAFSAASSCDVLLSVGTSGVVYPAAEIPRIALESGAALLHINPDAVAGQQPREFAITGNAGEVLPALLERAFR